MVDHTFEWDEAAAGWDDSESAQQKLSQDSSLSGSFDVEDGVRRKLKETDPHRLEQRQKAIDKGKNTRAYQNYIKLVPKKTRPTGGTLEVDKKYPRTPNKRELCSKRAWDGKVRHWRIRLHEWDPEGEEGEEIIDIPTAIPRSVRDNSGRTPSTDQQRHTNSFRLDPSNKCVPGTELDRKYQLKGRKREREPWGSPDSAKRQSMGAIGDVLPDQIRVSSTAASYISPNKEQVKQDPAESAENNKETGAKPGGKSIFDDWNDEEDDDVVL